MSKSLLLADAIEQWIKAREAEGYARNTIKRNGQELRKLLATTGNISTRSINRSHIDRTIASLKLNAAAQNNLYGTYRRFFEWCHAMQLMGHNQDPMRGIRGRKIPRKESQRIPLDKFSVCLDAAGHPRDRIVIALGLYLFLRQSEIRTLRYGDLHLGRSEILVTIHKSSTQDWMPISSELDAELRRWLMWYQTNCGELQPEWYLAPAKQRVFLRHATSGMITAQDPNAPVTPTAHITNFEGFVHGPLKAAGIQRYDLENKSNMVGVHTLRKSGARARFDELAKSGYDGALREVQAMLHHANSTMTEHYLGLALDVKRRDANVKGKSMFPSLSSSEVVSLHGGDHRAAM